MKDNKLFAAVRSINRKKIVAGFKRITPFKKALAVAAGIIAVAVAITWSTQPGLRRIGTVSSLLTEDAPPILPVPVEGVARNDLVDTWGAPRSGNRRHEGIDIFAPRGRPVRSVTRGVVFKVGENNLGGHVVEVLGPGGYWHYYAHLDRFADIEPGDVVEKGTILGYVGDSGNAKGTPFHLHYGVYGFWGGAQNPYPLLAGGQKDEERRDAKEARRADAKTKPRPRKQPARAQKGRENRLISRLDRG